MAGASATGLLLFLFVGISALQNGWRPKQDYKFSITGRSLANLPDVDSMSDQFTGIHYNGILRVQSITSNVLIMKFQNMTYSKLHADLPEGWWGPIPSSEENYMDMPFTDSTFTVKLDHGVVSNIVLTSNTADWEKNFIKGLVSHLQLDLSGTNTLHKMSSNSIHGRGDYQNTPIYNVMEDGVAGRCEVQYEVATLPKAAVAVHPDWMPRADLCGSRQYMEVTKTRNFSNCESTAEYHYGLPSGLKCQPGGNQCGQFWTRASVTRMTGCGDRKDFFLLSSVTSSRVLASLHLQSGSDAAVSSNLNISLLSAKPVGRRFNLPTNPTKSVKSLLYQYTPPFFQPNDESPINVNTKPDESLDEINSSSDDDDEPRKPSTRGKNRRRPILTSSTVTPVVLDESSEESGMWQLPRPDSVHPPHRPFSGFALAHVQGDTHSCLVQQMRELVTDIASDLEAPKFIPEKMTLEKVNLAVEMCRTMMFADLQKAVHGIMDIQIRDNRLLLTERKIFRDIMTMCGTNPAFRIIKGWIEQKKVKDEAAADMLANLPNYLQTPDTGVIQQFYEMTRSSAVRDDQQLQISAVLAFSNLLRVACVSTEARRARYPVQVLGTLCTPETALHYLPWLSGQLRANPALRRVFVTALGNTAISSALVPLTAVAEDDSASPYLRATAVLAMRYILLRNPQTTVPTLVSLYHSTGQPLAVRMAALSMLFYAKSDLVLWQRIAVSTWYEPSAAVTAFVWSSLKSMATCRDPVYKYMSDMATAVLPLAKPAALGRHLPHNLMWSSVREDLSLVTMDQLSFSSDLGASHIYHRHTRRQAGLSRILTQAELWVANPDDFFALLSEMVRPTQDVSDVRPPIANLPRSTRWIREQLKIAPRNLPRVEGDLHFSFNKLIERIFPFDKKILNEAIKSGRKFAEQMKMGKSLHYQKLGQDGLELATTTDLGLPVTFRLKTLWALRSTGEAKLSSNNMELGLDISAMYTSQLMSELSFFPAWDGVEHMAGSYGTTLIKLPSMRFRSSLHKPSFQLQLQLELLTPSDQLTVINHSSKPFTSQRDILTLSPTSLAKGTRFATAPPPQQRQKITVPHIDISYASKENPKTISDWLQSGSLIHNFPMMWQSLEPGYFILELNDLAPIFVNISLGQAEVYNGTMSYILSQGQNELNQANGMRSEESMEYFDTNKDSGEGTNFTSTPYPDSDEQVTTPHTSAETTEQETTTPASTTTEYTTTEFVFDNVIDNEDTSMQSTDDETDFPSHTFNATSLEPFTKEINGSNYAYVLTQALSGIRIGRAMLVEVNASILYSEPTHHSAIFVYGESLARKIQRAGIFLYNQDTKEQLGITGSIQSPSVPLLSLRNILASNMSSQIFAEATHRNNDSAATLTMRGTMSRGPQTTAALVALRQTQACLEQPDHYQTIRPACRNVAYKASFIDRYSMLFTYNEEAKERMSGAGHMGPNIARAVLQVERDSSSVDLWAQALNREMEYTGIQLPGLVAGALRPSAAYSLWERLHGSGYCGVDDNHVVTYDGVEFDYYMGDCWHVLSKDCSGKSRVVVLARTIDNITEVEVNVDNHKVVSLKPNLQAVNQKPVALSGRQVVEVADRAGTLLLQMSTGPDQAVKLTLPAHDMTILYSNSSVVIAAAPGTRGRLCGLCGDNDGEQMDDLRNSRGVLEKNAADFAASYALRQRDCHMPKYL